jgi:hypothetical protein
MSRIRSIAAWTVAIVFVLIPFVFAQSPSPNQSAGTVAQAGKDAKNQPVKAAKVFANDVLTSRSADASARSASSSPAVAQGNQDEKKESADHSATTTNVLDRPKDPSPDGIVIPAGTELKVNIGQHKTVVPVRVGFATPIPALSQVTVQVTRSYVVLPYPNAGGPTYTPNPNVDYTEFATITAVSVDGKAYQMRTDSVPLWRGGTNSEVTFVLSEPLKILR